MSDAVKQAMMAFDRHHGKGPGGGHGKDKEDAPLVDGLRQAADGKWYIPDPNRPGKYLEVVEAKKKDDSRRV